MREDFPNKPGRVFVLILFYFLKGYQSGREAGALKSSIWKLRREDEEF